MSETQVAIEDLLPRAEYSVYKLVRMASNRALELADGKKCLLEKVRTGKATTIALQEIAKGMIETPKAAEWRKSQGIPDPTSKSTQETE